MFQLRTEKGKLCVGNREVEAEPVYLGYNAQISFEGNIPPLETVIFDIISNMKKNNLIDLFDAKANAYRLFIIGTRDTPQQEVRDGVVPSFVEKYVIFDFYKIRPKSSEDVEK